MYSVFVVCQHLSPTRPIEHMVTITYCTPAWLLCSDLQTPPPLPLPLHLVPVAAQLCETMIALSLAQQSSPKANLAFCDFSVMDLASDSAIIQRPFARSVCSRCTNNRNSSEGDDDSGIVILLAPSFSTFSEIQVHSNLLAHFLEQGRAKVITPRGDVQLSKMTLPVEPSTDVSPPWRTLCTPSLILPLAIHVL